MNFSVVLESQNWPMDKSTLYFKYVKICHFIASSDIWVYRSWDVYEKIILVPSVNVSYIESLTSGWML